jgi:hypothetical protein
MRHAGITIFVLSLGLGACAPTGQLREKIPPVRAFEIGANIHMNEYERLDQLCSAGARWVRMDLLWPAIEPVRGQWDFSRADAALAQARRQGLKVYANLLYSPAWASGNGQYTGVPRQADWEDFVRMMARRYGGQVEAFGIWNEPNLDEFWAGNARDYTQVLLKPAYNIIHREAPGVKVAGPELAHLYSATIPVPKFLDEMRRDGGLEALDIFSHHVYGNADFRGKLDGFWLGALLFRPGLKQMLEAAGQGGREVWITEMGVDAAKLGEEGQAREMERQLRVLASLPWVEKAFVYEWQDNPDPAHHSGWGLCRGDGTVRPAYAALQRALLAGPL